MVPASALTLSDKLELRCQDRLRIRPHPQENISIGATLLPGTAVDVWQFSGWWEGVVISLDNIVADSLQVYFLGAFELFNLIGISYLILSSSQ
jgi:hypothetical protein